MHRLLEAALPPNATFVMQCVICTQHALLARVNAWVPLLRKPPNFLIMPLILCNIPACNSTCTPALPGAFHLWLIGQQSSLVMLAMHTVPRVQDSWLPSERDWNGTCTWVNKLQVEVTSKPLKYALCNARMLTAHGIVRLPETGHRLQLTCHAIKVTPCK